jgi:septin family protein
MKKVLTTALIMSFILTTQAYAADTYTQTWLDAVNSKIDKTAAPVLEKEKAVRAQQKAAQDKQQASVKAQQDLVAKKKQQVQTQKDLLNQQKNEIKNLFTIEK